MRLTLQERLLKRELGGTSRYSAIRGLYDDKAWIDDLDIVNELGGHSGCVNALSWSRSGRLLASGSDDQHLNIHSYQPESFNAPFTLTTSISTGHSANIFSVKFMPHSNDRILVTAAGDAEVRIFDIEHSGRSTIPSASSNLASSGRGRGFNNLYNGVRYLSDGDTDARVYRSHADRVKRIVTESSPHLFLTCSEDGEVRQWDLRQPSSAYPSPRGGRAFRASRAAAENENTSVPPPLISYKRYHLDLNTISCSPSQPHYIALGGAHLHCFLHDRRMLGRDILQERGQSSSSASCSSFERDDELLAEATKCVRRFAPNGQKKMKRTDNGHITACKISDANPNEMIASWSGERIYSFDLLRSPDARGTGGEERNGFNRKEKGRSKESRDRKRKRDKAGSGTLIEGGGRAGSKARQEDAGTDGNAEMALRVRYQNGQSEEIAIEPPSPSISPAQPSMREVREVLLSEPQKKSLRIAQALVKLRKELFGLETFKRSINPSFTVGVTPHTSSYTPALGYAAMCLPVMDELIRTWRYPVNPTEEDVIFQQTLRRNRESSRRFIQASGTLARALGGKLQTSGHGESIIMQYFKQITPSPNEGRAIETAEQFCYDFLKAITLWLDGGPEALLQGFKRSPNDRNVSPRFPISDAHDLSALDNILIPYLLQLATTRVIPNIDASRFEHDESRVTFQTETSAVVSFAHAIKIPFGDPPGAVSTTSSDIPGSSAVNAEVQMQNKSAAIRFWGIRVARGVLINAGEHVNFSFVDRAFGGLGTAKQEEEERVQEDIDPIEEEQVVKQVNLVGPLAPRTDSEGGTESSEEAFMTSQDGVGDIEIDDSSTHGHPHHATSEEDEANPDEEMISINDIHEVIEDHQDSDNGDSDDEGDQEGDSDEEEMSLQGRQLMWRSAFDRSKMREAVEQDIPCSPHTRQYTGHCNVKTVKDVNFFGLQDEYVVSGSDCGHLFIWDRKTSQLLNILEGDGEVVNVVQGHPYEPMIAASGIDHTIKIFSPDARAQEDARSGVNVADRGSSGYSSLGMSRSHIGGRRRRRSSDTNTEAGGLLSRKCMQKSYEITSQNEVERQGGNNDAFITRGMLAQLAARLRSQQAASGEIGEGGERTVVLDENCAVSN
ncbi:MAG: hypothetical protein M1827_000978 [Pycnora praestabilis]|nr:MAG: hypothetical protein M1827_000978 [Pycnora praestabilis]